VQRVEERAGARRGTVEDASWAEFKSPTALNYMPWVGVFYCPALDYLADSFEALAAISPRPNAKDTVPLDRLGLLEQILRGTPKITHDRGLSPAKEAEIRNSVYAVLVHSFPAPAVSVRSRSSGDPPSRRGRIPRAG
jgi:hypothetical protein